VDDLWAAKSEDVGLIVRAVSFRDFQPMWSWSTNVTDRQTTCDLKTALCNRALHYSASRGKNSRLRGGRIGEGVDLREEWLDRLEERDKWLLMVVVAAAVDCESSLFSCRGLTIASNMSPITWKHGSTMKSIKPTHANKSIHQSD